MEVKKYTTYNRSLKDHEEYCLPSDINGLIADHKAVVNDKNEIINNMDAGNKFLKKKILELQNKIDELEKINDSLKCCGNCEHYNHKYGYDCCMMENEDDCNGYSNWIAKGIK